MQDRYNQDFSQEFTGRAWEQMRGMLDAEMPEERRRRPLLLWFLFGALPAVLLLVGGHLLSGTRYLPFAPREVVPALPAAPGPVLGEVPVALCPVIEEDAVILQSQGVQVKNVHPPSATSVTFMDKTLRLSPADLTAVAAPLVPARSAALEPLPGKSIAEIHDLPKIEAPGKENSLTVVSKASIDLGLRASWHNPVFLRPSGAELAFEAAIPLGRSRWRVETGLGYYTTNWERSSPVLGSFIRADDEALELDPGTNLGDVYSGVTAEEVANKTSNIGGEVYYPARLHYLTLPLGLSCQAAPRLHLRAGAQVRYLIANQFLQQKNLSGVAFQYLFDEERLVNSPVALVDEAEALFSNLNKWNVAVYMGVDLELGRHFRLGMAYHQGLLDLLPDVEGQQQFGSLNLSVGLRF